MLCKYCSSLVAWFAASCLCWAAENTAVSSGLQSNCRELNLAARTAFSLAFLAEQDVCYLLTLSLPPHRTGLAVFGGFEKSLFTQQVSCEHGCLEIGFRCFPQLSPGPASCKLKRFYRNCVTSLPLLPGSSLASMPSASPDFGSTLCVQ